MSEPNYCPDIEATAYKKRGKVVVEMPYTDRRKELCKTGNMQVSPYAAANEEMKIRNMINMIGDKGVDSLPDGELKTKAQSHPAYGMQKGYRETSSGMTSAQHAQQGDNSGGRRRRRKKSKRRRRSTKKKRRRRRTKKRRKKRSRRRRRR